MKLLSTILTLHILFLTVSPAFPNFFASSKNSECTESNCCSEKECADDTCPTNKDCSMTICNPFMVCCNCNAVVSQKQVISAPISFSDEKHFSTISENGFDYMAEAWNPPKTI